MLEKILNGLIDVLVAILNFFLALLPDTPFDFEPLNWGKFGQAIGAFFPLSSMVTHMATILTAFSLYYVVRWALRIIRQVR